MCIFFEGLGSRSAPSRLGRGRARRVAAGTHLVIQGQLAEGRDVLGPLHQHQQLLLHGLADVSDVGDLLPSDVSVHHRNWG